MKTEKNIFIAFILNLAFSLFELVGGLLTNSVAIASDALHDFGDAVSIGISWLLEKKSKKQPDESHTYGYMRYSVLGSVVTTLILAVGSLLVIIHAIRRLVYPVPIHYDGMILFAVVGVAVNFAAAWFTREPDSLNQRAVNLHMLEDVLGWAVVLIGAVIMRFVDLPILDPLLSVGVAVYILLHATDHLRQSLELFLEKTPEGLAVEQIREHLCQITGVLDVHHIHLWSMDGVQNYATMHIVTQENGHNIKDSIRQKLKEHGIVHVTLELELPGEDCHEKYCHIQTMHLHTHHHHHH